VRDELLRRCFQPDLLARQAGLALIAREAEERIELIMRSPRIAVAAA
jgi:hypothetical protein